MSDLEDLLNYEPLIDRTVAELPILRLPVRVSLSMIMRVLHGLQHGTSTTGVPPNLDAANSFASRISHLVQLLANCPAEPTGIDAREVADAYHDIDRDGSQAKLLISYAHFADFMPEVRRGYFSVLRTGRNRFSLRHCSHEFEDAETRDILLSELALAFRLQSHPFSDKFFDGLTNTRAGHLSAEAVLAIKALGDHYSRHAFEVRLIDDDGLRAALGVTNTEFARFRGALFGMAMFAVELARAFERRLARDQNDEEAFSEWLHWVAPTWGPEFFRGYLITESGLSDTHVEKLLKLLSIDFRTERPPLIKHARDGYFPPVWQLPDMLLLCVDPVLLFTQVRNLLFSLQFTDKALFDNSVSKHLEPMLIRAAKQILASLGHLHICQNVNWSSGNEAGEIDLLIFDSGENVALHVQAKAPLGPQGARLVQRLEDRLDEGIRQLERFRKLPDTERDRVVSEAVKRDVKNVRVLDAVLARSCFGTRSICEKAKGVNLLALPILAGATAECVAVGQCGIEHLLQQCQMLTAKLVHDAKPRWDHETLVVDELQIQLPLLHFDQAAVARLRSYVWRDNMSLGVGA